MRMHAARGHIVLGSAVLTALVIGACGGEAAPAPGPQVPTPPAASSAAPATTAPTTAPPASGSAATGTTPPPAAAGPMKNIGTSTMADDLKKLGIDPLKPPALNKLTPDQVRKVMPSFQKALGVKCDFCHDTNNFKAWTPKKKIASRMWNDFVAGMRLEDKSPLYCDSCHGGKAQFLDRHDKKALSGWMDANYVSKLKRADGKEHSCEQCHGDPFEPSFLTAWANAK